MKKLRAVGGTLRRHPRPTKGVVFLDRDGVINVPPTERYITHWKKFRFLPGVFQALRTFRKAGWPVVIVSNQAGVGKGIMSAAMLREITRRMLARIRQTGGQVRAVYYCTHTPEKGCGCRKPKAGLVRKAARNFSINLKRSYVVGDNGTDLTMGRSTGCRTVLVLTGVTQRRAVGRLPEQPDWVARNLPEAVRWILNDSGGKP